MKYRLNEYSGNYLNPAIMDIYQRFPQIIAKAESDIRSRLGLKAPPDTVSATFQFVDSDRCIPMVTPTGVTMPSVYGDSFRIEICALAVANQFYGFTATDKVITHELVHAFFMYYGKVQYAVKPIWLKEGIALWTANQTFMEDFAKVPIGLRNERWNDYLSYITRFEASLNSGNSVDQIVRYLLG